MRSLLPAACFLALSDSQVDSLPVRTEDNFSCFTVYVSVFLNLYPNIFPNTP